MPEVQLLRPDANLRYTVSDLSKQMHRSDALHSSEVFVRLLYLCSQMDVQLVQLWSSQYAGLMSVCRTCERDLLVEQSLDAVKMTVDVSQSNREDVACSVVVGIELELFHLAVLVVVDLEILDV